MIPDAAVAEQTRGTVSRIPCEQVVVDDLCLAEPSGTVISERGLPGLDEGRRQARTVPVQQLADPPNFLPPLDPYGIEETARITILRSERNKARFADDGADAIILGQAFKPRGKIDRVRFQ